MFKKSLIAILLLVSLAATTAWAQPADQAIFPGDERPGRGRAQGERLNRMVEYLDLSESQAAQWHAIAEEHISGLRTRQDRMESLKAEFRSLADQENPNLEQLGQIALDLHREMETARSSRGELHEELGQILTPEQTERFEALIAAREFSGPRGQRGRDGRRGPREGFSPPDPD